MTQLFLDPQFPKPAPVLRNDVPAYRVLDERGFFADDTLWDYGAVIYFEDEPNDLLEPLNAVARERMKEFLTKIEGLGRAKAEKEGKAFVSRPVDDVLDDLREEKVRAQTVDGGPGTPVMGGRRKGKAKVKAVGAEDVPETGRKTRRSVEAA